MKHILLFLLIVYPSAGTKESLDDVSSLLDDPELLFELRKRLGQLLDDNVEEDDYSEPEVGCYALSGTLNGDCNFHTNGSTIIKTTESIGNGATFVSNIANVSCARDCTAACCLNEECDTALYQDKENRNCYLFKCGQPSRCVFVNHSDYWMSSSSKAVHTSHKYTPGGATYSHENELTSLGAHEPDNMVLKTTAKAIVQTTQTPRTPKPTTVPVAKVTYKPNLDEDCPSYETECADPHAECLMKKCRCRVGYHVKHNICRKHCQDYEFECDMIAYGGDAQCVHSTLVCNGKQDCEDGSDEYNCPSEREEKPAYQESDVSSSLYNSPLYNLPYANPPDTQYPYGFPIPLANQQQAGLLPSNQIYPNQIQPNGQYFYPNIANQNAVPQASNQLSAQQWPFLDRNVGIGSPILPNTNQGYQPIQQSGYLPAQPANYVPVVQHPANAPVLINPNTQPVQVLPKPVINPLIQPVKPVVVHQVTKAPVTLVQQTDKGPLITQERGQDHNEMNRPVPEQAGSPKQSSTVSKNTDRSNTDFDNIDDTVESRNEYYDDTKVTLSPQQPGFSELDHNIVDLNAAKAQHEEDQKSQNAGQHSAVIDDGFLNKPKTYPPSTKTKTQIGTPTQSTAAGQRHSQVHSEGFPDFSWVKYDSQSPRVSGKKGSSIHSAQHDDKEVIRNKPVIKLHDNKDSSGARKPAVNDHTVKQSNSNRLVPSKYDDQTAERNYDYETDRYPSRFPEYRRPGNDQRPVYDRYRDKYTDSRRRPGHGGRYPYYDTGYARGRDQSQYPVWDKFKDEYYYPDSFDAEADTPDIKHDLGSEDVPDVRLNQPDQQGPLDNDDQKAVGPTVGSVVTEGPNRVVSQGLMKDLPSDSPSITEAPVAVEDPAIKGGKNEEDQSSSESTDQNPATSHVDSTETDSEPSKESSGNDNNTDTNQDINNEYFRVLNADEVQVATYTDSSQGPIVALALGLSFTMMLLIFVGCRLRTVKRRLRKGRALHSNEADYLINGMYL